MTQKNLSAENTDELVKKRNLLTGVLIGIGIVYISAIAIAVYLLVVRRFKNISVAALIPVFAFPLVFARVLQSRNLLTKEIKLRDSEV